MMKRASPLSGFLILSKNIFFPLTNSIKGYNLLIKKPLMRRSKQECTQRESYLVRMDGKAACQMDR